MHMHNFRVNASLICYNVLSLHILYTYIVTHCNYELDYIIMFTKKRALKRPLASIPYNKHQIIIINILIIHWLISLSIYIPFCHSERCDRQTLAHTDTVTNTNVNFMSIVNGFSFYGVTVCDVQVRYQNSIRIVKSSESTFTFSNYRWFFSLSLNFNRTQCSFLILSKFLVWFKNIIIKENTLEYI